MFLARLKNFIATAGALLLALLLLLCVWTLSSDTFHGLEGERTYYLYSASSQATIKESLSLREIFAVEGESVQISVRAGEEGLVREKLDCLLKSLQAELVYSEQAGDAYAFYYFTPAWANGILVNGKRVNLHIAVGENRCVIGSPVIFGGF